MNKINIEVVGHIGTWYIIDESIYNGRKLYLLEHEQYGEETACIIVDEKLNIILDGVYNGFEDYENTK